MKSGEFVLFGRIVWTSRVPKAASTNLDAAPKTTCGDRRSKEAYMCIY